MKKLLFTILGIALLSTGLMAQTITPIPAGGSWTTARTTINANDEIASDSIAILQAAKAPLTSPTFTGTVSLPTTWRINGTTVTSMAAELNILDGALVTYAELNKLVGIGTDTIATRAYARLVSGTGSTDTTYLSARIDLKAPIANPNFTGTPRLATADTLATQAYARSYGGTGTVVIGDVRDEIADSLNALRPKTLVGNGTVGPYFDGSQDGGQILYFYGDNGFYTALQGGAPVANRSYRLPIAALPSAGTTSLLNIDQYGNMGFVASTTYVTPSQLSDSLAAFEGGGGVTIETVQGEISDSLNARIGAGIELSDIAVMIADSTGNAAGNYVTRQALIDSINANLGGAVGITLNSGTITLTGDAGTADDITFYTNGDGSYDLPAGGGNLTIMSQVQGWINDSLDQRLADAVEGLRLMDSLTVWVTPTQLVDSMNAIAGGLVIGDVRDEIADSLNVLRGDLLTIADVRGEIADSLDAARNDDSPIGPLFVFGAGSGFSADTALFNNNRLIGAYYNSGSDTLYVTELRGVMVEGTGTETIDVQVSWHANMRDGSAVNLNSTALTINNMTTGTADTSFDNNGIPPGVWVWGTLSGASPGNKPTMLILTMTGYKRNRSY